MKEWNDQTEWNEHIRTYTDTSGQLKEHEKTESQTSLDKPQPHGQNKPWTHGQEQPRNEHITQSGMTHSKMEDVDPTTHDPTDTVDNRSQTRPHRNGRNIASPTTRTARCKGQQTTHEESKEMKTEIALFEMEWTQRTQDQWKWKVVHSMAIVEWTKKDPSGTWNPHHSHTTPPVEYGPMTI